MNPHILLGLLIGITAAVTYAFFIRPALEKNPTFAEFYEVEGRFFESVRLKFGGIKGRLASAFFGAVSVIVAAYDFLAPLVVQSGVDVTKLSSKIPPDAWPFITLGVIVVLQWFRKLSENRPPADPLPPIPPAPPEPPKV